MSTGKNRLSRRSFIEKTGQAVIAGSLIGTATAKPLVSDRKIRMGIVGGGFGSTFQWHEDPNCVVHAVSDLRNDRRDKLMKTYKCEPPRKVISRSYMFSSK